MFITPVDLIVILVILISAFLAMVRGFLRELLSLLSWVVAAAAAYYLYRYLAPTLEKHLTSPVLAALVSMIAIFLVALFVISILTMRIADIKFGNRIGALDRTIGFLFGAARGLIIMALAALLINNLVKPENLSRWIVDAKTRPVLDEVAQQIWQVIPKGLILLPVVEAKTPQNDT